MPSTSVFAKQLALLHPAQLGQVRFFARQRINFSAVATSLREYFHSRIKNNPLDAARVMRKKALSLRLNYEIVTDSYKKSQLESKLSSVTGDAIYYYAIAITEISANKTLETPEKNRQCIAIYLEICHCALLYANNANCREEIEGYFWNAIRFVEEKEEKDAIRGYVLLLLETDAELLQEKAEAIAEKCPEKEVASAMAALGFVSAANLSEGHLSRITYLVKAMDCYILYGYDKESSCHKNLPNLVRKLFAMTDQVPLSEQLDGAVEKSMATVLQDIRKEVTEKLVRFIKDSILSGPTPRPERNLEDLYLSALKFFKDGQGFTFSEKVELRKDFDVIRQLVVME